jgi:tetratricopeptide (TPR) repeat protein
MDGYVRLQSQSSVPPAWAAELAKELADVYRKWHKPQQAAEWDRKGEAAHEFALERNSRLLRQQLDDTGLLLSQASSLTQLDRLHEAEAACLMAIKLDPKNPDVANQLLAVAYAHHQQRDWEQAGRLYRRALAIQRVVPEVLSTQVASTLHMLAVTLREKGDLAAAEEMHREALAILRKQLGDNHATTAREIHDLAFLLGPIPGRQTDAERLYREALQVRRQLLGDGDTDTVDTAFRLAQVLGAQGKFDEAETLLQEAHAALVANRASAPTRDFEPVLVRWIIEQYQGWSKPDRVAEWERKLPPQDRRENEPLVEQR